MIRWRLGIVQQAQKPAQGLQEVIVRLEDGTVGRAVYYTEEGDREQLAPGDQVLLNTTAVSLKLGTGGYHFVHAVLPSASVSSFEPESPAVSSTVEASLSGGHIVKLRYTSLQRTVLSIEEQGSPYHELFKQPLSLGGMPVLIGELHSMLPAVLCRLRQLSKRHDVECKVAYIMSDGGALPMAFSKHVRQLKQLGWLTGTVTYGQAYGGDVEAVNKFTALLAAKHVLHADIAIAVMGPGAVGTGSRLGFSGMEAGELINAADRLNGMPILIPRISFLDPRERHQGISHHLFNVLSVAACVQACVPMPILTGMQGSALLKQLEMFKVEAAHRLCWHPPVTDEDWDQALAAYNTPIYSMGRELREDAGCLAGLGAAADEAWLCWRKQLKDA